MASIYLTRLSHSSVSFPDYTHILSCSHVLEPKVAPKHLEALPVIRLAWFLGQDIHYLCTYGPILSESSNFIMKEVQTSTLSYKPMTGILLPQAHHAATPPLDFHLP